MKILPIIISFGLIGGCDLLEKVDEFYDSYSDAIQSQSYIGGWLPHNLPSSARDIYETHYVDRSSRLVKFSYSEQDGEALLDGCRPAGKNDIKFPTISAVWWPEYLTKIDDRTIRNQSVFWCETLDGYYSLKADEKIAYFWHP